MPPHPLPPPPVLPAEIMSTEESQSDSLQPHPSASATAGDNARGMTELRQQLQDMRTLLHAVFVALIVLALGVNLFFYKQMRIISDQLEAQRPQMQKAEAEYRTTREPEFKRFIAALQQFGMSHPEFQAGLNRYRTVIPEYFPNTGAVMPASPRPIPGTPAKAPGK